MALKSLTIEGKLKWHLLPLSILRGVVRVFMIGAVEYADFDWMDDVKKNPDTYKDALMRHFERYQAGEINDSGKKGTDELHLDCLIANAIILSWYEKQRRKKCKNV